jgi:hydrogenase maturation protease
VQTLVLGLGNPILSDDGVGIHIVRAAAGETARPDVTIGEACVGGLRLLDRIAGYDRLILVDAIQAGGAPGEVRVLTPGDALSSLHSASSHDLNLAGALQLGRWLGMAMPMDDAIRVVAVEAEDVTTFGEECTPAVKKAIPRGVRAVLREIDSQTAKALPDSVGCPTCA